MRNFKTLAATLLVSLSATAASADSWTLDPSMSNISFGSIKNNYSGESHSFSEVSGAVSEGGAVTLEVALASVDTLIDIRNERMVEFVFKHSPSAAITAEIDMAEFTALGVGEATTTETAGTLLLLGETLNLDASLFVMRLSEDKVMVTSNGMVMMSTEDAGINAGIDKLQELAGLDSITRVSPVTLRLMFDKN